MKKIKIVLVIIFGLLLCGCKKETVMKNINLGNYKSMYDSLNEYIQSTDYPILNTTVSFENGYTETFKLYRDLDINVSNYSDYTELASLEVNYTEVKSEANINKITYIFPKIGIDIVTENSLNAVKGLLEATLKGLIINENINFDEIFSNLNYPSNESILKLNKKYNSEYYIYLNDNKSNKLNIKFEEKNNYFVFTYEII